MRLNLPLFAFSGILSLIIELILFLLLFGIYHTSATKFAARNEATLQMQSIEIEALLDKLPSPKSNPLSGTGLKDMFAQVNVGEKAQQQETQDDRETLAQNAQAKLDELAKQSQSLRQKLNDLNKITIQSPAGASDGEFDEWFSQVVQILQRVWDQQTAYLPSNLVGVAQLEINENGQMRYKITRYSQTDIFDDALKNTLFTLKDTIFPAPPKQIAAFEVEFKSSQDKF